MRTRAPEGAIRCHQCGTDGVPLGRRYICDCTIKHVSRVDGGSAESLRRALSLLREQPTVCDRCDDNTAFRLTECAYGCTHAQCFGCADQTIAERKASRR